MSGGSFDHKQYLFDSVSDDIDLVIRKNDSSEVDEFGDKVGRGYSEEVIDTLKHARDIIQRAGNMANAVDYLFSEDYGEDSFLKRWDEVVNGGVK